MARTPNPDIKTALNIRNQSRVPSFQSAPKEPFDCARHAESPFKLLVS
jgi:hypothetical protein